MGWQGIPWWLRQSLSQTSLDPFEPVVLRAISVSAQNELSAVFARKMPNQESRQHQRANALMLRDP